jgi:homoserine kinase
MALATGAGAVMAAAAAAGAALVALSGAGPSVLALVTPERRNGVVAAMRPALGSHGEVLTPGIAGEGAA